MNTTRSLTHRQRLNRTALAFAALTSCVGAQAAELVSSDSLTVRWDNTVKYQIGTRTAAPSSYYLDNPNLNDGDASFARNGLISNRLDLLSEFDVALKTAIPAGLRISAAGWYDAVYNKSHQAVPTPFFNQTSVAPDQFTSAARRIAGRDGDLLDAFVYGGVDLGSQRLQGRLGRHTLLWGESLYLAGNGIAGTMASVDILKALTVPQTPAKELFRPTNQLSASLSLNDRWALQGYYQLEFRKNRFPPVGTFYAGADVLFEGMENLLTPIGPFAYRGVRDEPKSARGNWGLAAKYSNLDADLDLGFYYVRYTDRTPQLYTDAAGLAGTPLSYYVTYPKNIEVFGLSASTKVGAANVAGEASVRRNVPLISNGQLMDLSLNPAADNGKHPLYAVGDTLHLQASAIWVLPRAGLWDTASLTAEVGGHHLLKVRLNEAARDTTKKRTWAGTNVVFEPTWYQVVPDLDLSVPVSVGYSFTGYSPIDPTSTAHGGSASLGARLVWQRNWRIGLNYTTFLGKDSNNPVGDRDNLMLSIATTF